MHRPVPGHRHAVEIAILDEIEDRESREKHVRVFRRQETERDCLNNPPDTGDAEFREGDVLLLQMGDIVPADAKLLEASGLEIDEFDLTGEIFPVEKKVEGNKDMMVYGGSRVIRGSGKGIIVAVGADAEYGKILAARYGPVTRDVPPLISKKYAVAIVFVLPMFAAALLASRDVLFAASIFFGIATLIMFALNRTRIGYAIAKREAENARENNVQISDENALEKFQSIDVVCFDKTGVLTTHDIEVNSIHLVDGAPGKNTTVFKLVTTACALCNDVFFLDKPENMDPVDKALISFASENGIDVGKIMRESKRIYDKPFDSENRYMACGFVSGDDERRLFLMKGDPDIVRRMCKSCVTTSGEERSWEIDFISAINSKNIAMNAEGFKTIALAYGHATSDDPPSFFTFLSLVQLENPVKPGTSDVIKKLKQKGIRPIILTGDRSEAAVKVGRDIGIDDASTSYLTGDVMQHMELEEIRRQSDYVSTYARLTPSQKALIVKLLQQKDHVVCMLGDGPNDTIAVKVADIGISFVENSATLAKRVSKILINNLAALLAIMESARKIERRSMLFTRLKVIVVAFFLGTLLLKFMIWAWSRGA
nr:HAD family hydrolase [Candidatus Sigynarchaeota archaeon]